MLSAALCTTADGRLCQTHACAGPRHSTWCDATNGRAGRCAPACFGLLLHVWASELRGCDLLAEATPSHGLRRLKSVAFKSAQLASDVSSGAALPTLAHSRHIVAELSHLASNSFELWLGMRQPRVRRTEEGCTVEAARLLTFQGELVMDLLAAAIANKSRESKTTFPNGLSPSPRSRPSGASNRPRASPARKRPSPTSSRARAARRRVVHRQRCVHLW